MVRLVLRSLDLAVAQTIGLVETGGDLLLDGKRQLERHRRDGLDEQRADGGIDPGADDALARRVTEESCRARRTRSWG